MSKEIIPCICMTCGVRNDFSTDNGYCQNGHDNWLEYRDVFHTDDNFDDHFLKQAMHIFNMNAQQLSRDFKNVSIKQFTVVNPI